MSSRQEVHLQPRVMARHGQAGLWGQGQAENRLGYWPTGGPGLMEPMARTVKARASWKLTACGVAGTGTDCPGLG